MSNNKEQLPPRILYYQIKGRFVYWIYEFGGKHHLVEVLRVPNEEGLIKFLKESEGSKSLSTVIDIHDYTDHLNLTYKDHG